MKRELLGSRLWRSPDRGELARESLNGVTARPQPPRLTTYLQLTNPETGQRPAGAPRIGQTMASLT